MAYIKENVPAACRLVPTVLGSQPPLPSSHSSDLVIVIIITIIIIITITIIILTEISIKMELANSTSSVCCWS